MLIKFFEDLFSHYSCSFRRTTGLYCPGCGGLRSSLAFMKGEIVGSVRYNPVVPYVVFALGLYLLLMLKYRFDKKLKPGFKYALISLLLGIGIAMVNFVVKDYYLIVKGIDLLR